MEEIRISNAFTIGPQPATIDAHELLEIDGFKTIVNLSVKGELDQALNPYEASVMAENAGLRYIHLPVSLSSLKYDHVDEFLALTDGQPGGTYVHCRIGQRSGPFCLIAHALQKNLPMTSVVPLARKLGIMWRAEMITDFIHGYLERHRTLTMAAAA